MATVLPRRMTIYLSTIALVTGTLITGYLYYDETRHGGTSAAPIIRNGVILSDR